MPKAECLPPLQRSETQLLTKHQTQSVNKQSKAYSGKNNSAFWPHWGNNRMVGQVVHSSIPAMEKTSLARYSNFLRKDRYPGFYGKIFQLLNVGTLSIFFYSYHFVIKNLKYIKKSWLLHWTLRHLSSRLYHSHFTILALSYIYPSMHLFSAFQSQLQTSGNSPLNTSQCVSFELRICSQYFVLVIEANFTNKEMHKSWVCHLMHFDKHIHLYNPNACQGIKHFHHCRKLLCASS